MQYQVRGKQQEKQTISQNITHGIKQAIQNNEMTNLPVHNELSKVIKSCYFWDLFFVFNV